MLAGAPGALLYPVLAAAGVTAMCWNGLAFTAAAEIAGRDRAGTAMSLQNTIVSIGGTRRADRVRRAGGGDVLAAGVGDHRARPARARSPCSSPLMADERRRAALRHSLLRQPRVQGAGA